MYTVPPIAVFLPYYPIPTNNEKSLERFLSNKKRGLTYTTLFAAFGFSFQFCVVTMFFSSKNERAHLHNAISFLPVRHFVGAFTKNDIRYSRNADVGLISCETGSKLPCSVTRAFDDVSNSNTCAIDKPLFTQDCTNTSIRVQTLPEKLVHRIKSVVQRYSQVIKALHATIGRAGNAACWPGLNRVFATIFLSSTHVVPRKKTYNSPHPCCHV